MSFTATRRERILIYGGSDAGKSYTYLGLMDFARKTKTDSHFWIIDNDNATEGIGLYPGGSFGHLLGEEQGEVEDEWKGEKEGATYGQQFERATIWVPETFDDYNPIKDHIKKRVKPDDFIVIDMMSNVWEIMPDWWIENVYGDNTWEYYAGLKRAVNSDDPDERKEAARNDFGGLPGGAWQYVGKVYRKWEKSLTLFSPCHVLALSAESEVLPHYDTSGEDQAKWKKTSGFRPKVEKNAPHRFHTLMRANRLLARDGKSVKSRELTVWKDRDRMERWDEVTGKSQTLELSEGPKFAWDYLVKIGGWKPV